MVTRKQSATKKKLKTPTVAALKAKSTGLKRKCGVCSKRGHNKRSHGPGRQFA